MVLRVTRSTERTDRKGDGSQTVTEVEATSLFYTTKVYRGDMYGR